MMILSLIGQTNIIDRKLKCQKIKHKLLMIEIHCWCRYQTLHKTNGNDRVDILLRAIVI